jgi:hypothetical protein
MPRVDVPAQVAEFIRERIEKFDIEAPRELQWQAGYVREHQALPLYLGWTETLGIRADGLLIRWSTENEWPGVREFGDSTWVNIALVQGAIRFPQLQSLIPKRPATATTCETCQGTGKLGLPPEYADVICKCGGIGWIPITPPK